MKLIILTLLQIAICHGGINEDNFVKIQKQIPDTWLDCSAGTDCMVVPSHCSIPQSLNKKFQQELYNFLYIKRNELKKCIDLAPPKWPNGAICEKEKCISDWGKKEIKSVPQKKAVTPIRKIKGKEKG
ncbi:MAG TPA: hypothetical protein VNJ08_10420 [Bacteriovoracaceae bacterium]|nr:hypothetical protein [Bacteriovoracaceae bacterium]